MNKALLLSCQKGLPVRVVRSHKVRGGGEAGGCSNMGGQDKPSTHTYPPSTRMLSLTHAHTHTCPRMHTHTSLLPPCAHTHIPAPMCSHKHMVPPPCPRMQEKRSSYAPTEKDPVRYDGVYRILKAWRKPGNQKLLMCRWAGRAGAGGQGRGWEWAGRGSRCNQPIWRSIVVFV